MKEQPRSSETPSPERIVNNGDRIWDLEFDCLPKVDAKEERYYRGTLVSTKPGPTHLSMTEQEWDAFGREDDESAAPPLF